MNYNGLYYYYHNISQWSQVCSGPILYTSFDRATDIEKEVFYSRFSKNAYICIENINTNHMNYTKALPPPHSQGMKAIDKTCQTILPPGSRNAAQVVNFPTNFLLNFMFPEFEMLADILPSCMVPSLCRQFFMSQFLKANFRDMCEI